MVTMAAWRCPAATNRLSSSPMVGPGLVPPHVLWLVRVLLVLGVLAGTDLLSPAYVDAQKCELDAGGGCKRENLPCSPPTGGKCVTRKSAVELTCNCEAPKSSGGGALALGVFLATAAAWHYWRRR
jgi:hypothetical protein